MIGKFLVLSLEIIGIVIGSFILGVIILGVLILKQTKEKKLNNKKSDENLTKQSWRKKYSKEKIICLPKYMKGRKTLIFENMVECADYFGISLFYLKDLIESGTVYKQYFFDLEV